MSQDAKKEIKIQYVNVLSAVQYRELEKKVSRLMLSSTTTQLEVAHQMGVQYVLKVIREGFVNEG